MIGSIRPNWKSFDCLETRESVTQAMCHTCVATGNQFGLTARMGLSHDMIFLATLSGNNLFHNSRLSPRPLRCCIGNGTLNTPDAQYLSAVTVFTSAIKIRDAISYRSEEHTSELQSPCNLVCR